MSYQITLSGLTSIDKQISNISNNIANVSTTGYRAATTQFSSIYSGAQPGGVEVSAVTQNFSQPGSLSGTGKELDLAISGDGMFVLKDSQGQSIYSRNGNFNLNADNQLVDAQGNKVMGFGLDANGGVEFGSLSELTVRSEGLVAQETSRVEFQANFDSRMTPLAAAGFDQTDPATYNSSYSTQLFDSLGNEHTLTQYFLKTNTNEWQVHYSIDGEIAPTTGANGDILEFNSDGQLNTVNGNPMFDAAGNPTQPEPTANLDYVVTNGANNLNIDVAYRATGQLGSEFSVVKNQTDGYASGELIGVTVDNEGLVSANYSNGLLREQGMIALANFTNLDGLRQVNGTAWSETLSSGDPVFGQPNSGSFGQIDSGALESSNVNLTGELVSLISAQRNYQANAQTLSTLNQLSQTLFQNL
jgi:flagellar hook protein FlgE